MLQARVVPVENRAVEIWLCGCADVGAEDGFGDVAAGEDGDCEGAHAWGWRRVQGHV